MFRKFLETWHTFRTPKVIFFNFGKSANDFFLPEKNPISIFKIGLFCGQKLDLGTKGHFWDTIDRSALFT